jgi:hypothetical protein
MPVIRSRIETGKKIKWDDVTVEKEGGTEEESKMSQG